MHYVPDLRLMLYLFGLSHSQESLTIYVICYYLVGYLCIDS